MPSVLPTPNKSQSLGPKRILPTGTACALYLLDLLYPGLEKMSTAWTWNGRSPPSSDFSWDHLDFAIARGLWVMFAHLITLPHQEVSPLLNSVARNCLRMQEEVRWGFGVGLLTLNSNEAKVRELKAWALRPQLKKTLKVKKSHVCI